MIYHALGHCNYFFLGLTTIFCVLGHPVIAVDPEATNLAYLYKSLGRYYCTAFMYLLYFAYFMYYIFYLFVMEKSLGRYYCTAFMLFIIFCILYVLYFLFICNGIYIYSASEKTSECHITPELSQVK